MFYCTVCKKDFMNRKTLLYHKKKSKKHHENDLVYSYKDTIGKLDIDTIRSLDSHDIRAYKKIGRKTALHIYEE